MLLSYKPLHLEAQQRLLEEGCVVDISSHHAHANKVLERGHNLRLGGQGIPNGRCCFLDGGSNICLGDSNWRERHNNCPFRSGGLSPDGGRPQPCRGRPRPAPGGHHTNRTKLLLRTNMICNDDLCITYQIENLGCYKPTPLKMNLALEIRVG